jgi:hypothetical protein
MPRRDRLRPRSRRGRPQHDQGRDPQRERHVPMGDREVEELPGDQPRGCGERPQRQRRQDPPRGRPPGRPHHRAADHRQGDRDHERHLGQPDRDLADRVLPRRGHAYGAFRRGEHEDQAQKRTQPDRDGEAPGTAPGAVGSSPEPGHEQRTRCVRREECDQQDREQPVGDRRGAEQQDDRRGAAAPGSHAHRDRDQRDGDHVQQQVGRVPDRGQGHERGGSQSRSERSADPRPFGRDAGSERGAGQSDRHGEDRGPDPTEVERCPARDVAEHAGDDGMGGPVAEGRERVQSFLGDQRRSVNVAGGVGPVREPLEPIEERAEVDRGNDRHDRDHEQRRRHDPPDVGTPARGGAPRVAAPGGAVHRSHVWMMTFRKFQPYRSDFGFLDSPPARARNVTGTSTTRARCRSASIRISLVQN